MSDPDNKPLTDSDLRRMKRRPQVRIVRRALQLTQEEWHLISACPEFHKCLI